MTTPTLPVVRKRAFSAARRTWHLEESRDPQTITAYCGRTAVIGSPHAGVPTRYTDVYLVDLNDPSYHICEACRRREARPQSQPQEEACP